jgi:hypothetical protein
MSRVSRVLFVAVALLSLAGVVAGAPADKWARGTITAVGADSITLDVKGQAMTFKVEPATDVIAPGAGTKAREAAKTPGGKPKVSDLLKVGDRVEVRYTEADGAMTAAVIRGGLSAADMTSAEAEKMGTRKARGVVTAVSNTALTIKADDGSEMAFTADAKVRVVGTGLGTMAREKAAKDTSVTLTDALTVGDTVAVSYKASGDVKQLTTVSVVKKGT